MNQTTNGRQSQNTRRPGFWLAAGVAVVALLTCPGCTNILKDRALQVAESAFDTLVYEVIREVNTEIQSW